MKVVGTMLMAISVIWWVFALSMDISVASGFGRVVNSGMMQSQQNQLTIAQTLFLSGIILFGFGSVADRLSPKRPAIPPQVPRPSTDQARSAADLGMRV